MDKKLLCDYKDELKSTHGYTEETAENIAMMAESIANYYGDDYKDVIYDAIKSCKFISAKNKKSGIMETTEDILKNNGIDTSLTSHSDLKSATVAYGAAPTIVAKNGQYELQNVARVMALSPRFSWDNPDSLNNLAIEADRLLGNYLQGYTIDENSLTIREGFRTKSISLSSNKNGEVEGTIVEDVGSGLEEGTVLYEAQSITRENYSPTYDATGYDYTRISMGNIIDNLKLSDLIKTARVTKDKREFVDAIDKISSRGFGALESTLDELYRLETSRRESFQNPQDVDSISRQLDTHFQNEVGPIMVEMASTLGPREEMQNVIR